MNFLFGGSGDNHAKKGIEAVNNGHFAQAVQQLETALSKGTKSHKKHELLAILGRAYQQLGNSEKAIESCNESLKLAPNYPAAWNNMGIAYRSLGNMEEAEKSYLQAISIDPNYAHAHASLGALYIHLGRSEDAKNALERSIQINPSLAIAHGNLALSYAMLGDFAKANAELKQAISLGYKTWKEVADRIQALAASSSLYEQSEKVTISLEPTAGYPFTRYPITPLGINLTREADELMTTGKRREAINIYKKVLVTEPNCSYVLVQYGLGLQEESRVADAIKQYSLAIQIDSDFGYAYYARGWAKHFLSDYHGELNDAKTGLNLDKQNPGIYLRRIGAAYSGMRKFIEALEAYSQAIEINPKDEGTIYNRGLCYMEMKEYDKAVDEFSRALQLDPDWDWALISRSIAYMKLGDKQKALDDINETLKYHPNHKKALQLREMLQE